MCTILSFLPHPISLFLVICFELPITRIPDSQKSAVVKMIKTWIHRFAVKNIPKMKRHRSIVLSAATYLHVTPSYGTSTFQHFFVRGECVAFYLANRKRRAFMPLLQPIIFLYSCSVVVLCLTCAGSHLEEKYRNHSNESEFKSVNLCWFIALRRALEGSLANKEK